MRKERIKEGKKDEIGEQKYGQNKERRKKGLRKYTQMERAGEKEKKNVRRSKCVRNI